MSPCYLLSVRFDLSKSMYVKHHQKNKGDINELC